MKNFVRYLYAYKDGKCVQNVGFVKCEESGGKAILQIYGKGFPVNGNDRFELFVFYPEGEKCIGISMGTLENRSPVFSYRLEYDADDVGGLEIFDRVDGLILIKGQGREKNWYAAKWEESSLNIEQMICGEDCMKEPEEVEKEEPQGEETVEEEAAQEEELVEEAAHEEVPIEEEPQEEETSREMIVEEETREKDIIYKITREDLAKLPRCEWKLANNHFLLHGYRNYHHLVSFEKGGSCWIGVPGVFHPSEQKVAQAFGFDQFMRPDEGEIELSEEQREEDEEFGYWCRTVSTVIEG